MKTFKPTGLEFGATADAEAWLRSKGWSYGPHQRAAPRGIARCDASIAKWRNLSLSDRRELDGEIRYSDGDCIGPVEVWLKP